MNYNRMNPLSIDSRFFENFFEDYKEDHADSIPRELDHIKSVLESKQFFLKYLDQINESYPYNDVYVGKYGILLFYFFLQKKFPQFREKLLSFYSSCIVKCDQRCHALISFHCGEAGIYAIESVIQHIIFNDQRERDKYLAKLVGCVEDAINPRSKNYDELLYGRVSLLYALCFVENELKHSVNIQELDPVIQLDDCKKQVVQKILSSGIEGRQRESTPILSYHYSWHGKEYTGAAHGYSGIYYLLLKNRQYCTSEQLYNLITSSLCLVQTQLLRTGNMTSKLNGRDNDLVQFCHGAPGFIYLLGELYIICRDNEQYKRNLSLVQQIADKCLNTIWKYGIVVKGMNLCHGVAGNAYAFLSWYRRTGDRKSMFRAIQFAKYCLNFDERYLLSDRPLSLYEGLAGIIWYLVDILDPNSARFPAFEL